MSRQIILFQGDSVTDAERVRDRVQFQEEYSGSCYATLIKAQLGFEHPGQYEFINRAVSGNRVVDVYARYNRDIRNLKPDVLSILIGVNDVWHEFIRIDGEPRANGISAPKFERIYDMMLADVRQELPDCRIILLEPFVLEGTATCNTEEDPARWPTFQREVALRGKVTRRLAEKYGAVFVPLQQVFDAACQQAGAAYWLEDGVHPSPMGHELIKQAWLQAAAPYL